MGYFLSSWGTEFEIPFLLENVWLVTQVRA